MTNGSEPVISVAIATRNYGRYLPRALDSVLRSHNPTGAPVQVVVADDASTDNTRALLAEYRRRYPENLEVVLIRAPEGVGAAKNAALDRCRGRTVAILDADDEFLPEKLIRCHAVLESGQADLVTHDFYHQVEGGETIPRTRRAWKGWRTWGNWFWPPSTWVFRRGMVRFNPYSLGAEDLEWLERRGSSARCFHLDLPLGVQHVHLNSPHLPRGHYGLLADSQAPAFQVTGRILGRPHANDRLAPPVWACRACGNQYLLPARCCNRDAVERPLLFYWALLSPFCPLAAEFSLVMPTRNGLALTRRAVSSILERVPVEARREVELIFVDGYSSDGTLDYLRKLAETHPVKVMVTHPSEPFNYARACNRGAHAARGKYLLLLNNDIELRSDDPWGPLRAALEDPRVGAVGASTEFLPAQREAEWRSGSFPYRFVDRPLTGDFWGMRREVYWELGGMDEAFAGYGHDEIDFQLRARLAHYLLALARVRAHHDLHATFHPVHGWNAMKEMELLNRGLFQRKHARWLRRPGAQGDPLAKHGLPGLSLVVVARDEVSWLRQTLERAVRDPGCHDGTIQLVVVDNGSTDDTPLLLAAYRLRLPFCLSVVALPEPVGMACARQRGQARAIGRAIRMLNPGDWQTAATRAAGSAEAPCSCGCPPPPE